MATSTKADKKATPDSIEDGVRGFSMALREAIMDYYKGTCIQSFGSLSQYYVGCSRIPLQNDGSRRNFNYERDEHQRRNPIIYRLDNAPMFELWKYDHEVIFDPIVMRRSEELSMAYDQILSFFNKFLPSVTIVERETEYSRDYANGKNDKKYIYRTVTDQISRNDDDDEDEEDDPYDEDF